MSHPIGEIRKDLQTVLHYLQQQQHRASFIEFMSVHVGDDYAVGRSTSIRRLFAFKADQGPPDNLQSTESVYARRLSITRLY